MKIEVKSAQVFHKSVMGKTSGRTSHFVEQEAWAEVNGEYRRLRVSVPDEGRDADGRPVNPKPYPVGFYEVSEASYSVNGFGGLEFGFGGLKLKAVHSSDVRKVG